MAYYYVKNGETAGTAGGTTLKTGAFSGLASTTTWGSIQSAIDDGGAGSGDFICVSDAHAFTTTSLITYQGPTSGDYLYIVCVDDANVENEAIATAALEDQQSATNDISHKGRISHFGMYYKAVDIPCYINGDNGTVLAENCTIENTGSGQEIVRCHSDGCYFRGINCTLKGATDAFLAVNGGSTIDLRGGSVNTVAQLTASHFASGGGHVYCDGVDLSTITGTVFKNFGGNAAGDDTLNNRIVGCKLNASPPSWFNETLENSSQRLIATNSSATSSAAEYQFYVEAYGGNVEDETTIYRDESTAFPSGTQISLKCVTSANATAAAPFWFDLPTRFVKLSNAASDVIRIYLASDFTTAPTDAEIWAEAVYPDGTTKNEYNFISSRTTNILGSGTTLTTDSGSDWRDGAGALTGHDEQYIELDIGSFDAGADGVPTIRVYVAKYESAKNIFFCPTLGLS